MYQTRYAKVIRILLTWWMAASKHGVMGVGLGGLVQVQVRIKVTVLDRKSFT